MNHFDKMAAARGAAAVSWVPDTTPAESQARTVLLQTAARLARSNTTYDLGCRIRDAMDALTAERNRLLAGWWGEDEPPAVDVLRAHADRLEARAKRYREAADTLEAADKPQSDPSA